MKMLCIKSCLQCNHLSLSSYQCWNPVCKEDQPIIDDIKTIPELCPLEDAPSELCQAVCRWWNVLIAKKNFN